MKKLSLIVTTYNLEKYILRCLNSILCNKSSEFEVIVVDDGSKDSTLDIIDGNFGHDERLFLVKQENSGVTKARENGLLQSSGEYIWFIDGDDWIENQAIDILLQNIRSKKDLYIFNYLISYDDKKEKSIRYHKNLDLSEFDLLKGLFVNKHDGSLWNKIFKKSFLINNNIKFIDGLRVGEDTTFSIYCAMHNPTVSTINEAFYNYYQRDDSVTKVLNNKLLDIEKMFRYIESKLIELKLEYREELEYFIYLHSLKYRIKEIFIYESEYSEKYFEIWSNKRINITTNKYFKADKLCKEKLVVYLANINYSFTKKICNVMKKVN